MQRNARTWLFSSVGLSLMLTATGCGDDGGNSGGNDGSVEKDTSFTEETSVQVDCPEDAPDMGAGLMGPCCYRKEQGADADRVDLRLSALDIQTPASLSNNVVQGIVSNAFKQETFSWLLTVEGARSGGAVSVTTGFADRNEDGSFSYAVDNAPVEDGGAADRWNPAEFSGEINGEVVTGSYDGGIILPLGGRDLPETDMNETVLELPLQGIELTNVELSSNRSCVGTYSRSGGYDVESGAFQTFVRVEAASEGTITALGELSLCNFIGNIQGTGNCEEVARAQWDNPPNALCNDQGCTADPGDGSVCDTQSDCNAWVMRAKFAAMGVEVK